MWHLRPTARVTLRGTLPACRRGFPQAGKALISMIVESTPLCDVVVDVLADRGFRAFWYQARGSGGLLTSDRVAVLLCDVQRTLALHNKQPN